MAINPHRKGGTDVPVTDGGTGASDGGNALTNLGGLDETAHDALDHAGLTGIPPVVATPVVIHQVNPNVSPSPFNFVVPANTLVTDGDELYIKLVQRSSAGGSGGYTFSLGAVNVMVESSGFTDALVTFEFRFYKTGGSTARVIGKSSNEFGFNSTAPVVVTPRLVALDSIAVNWSTPLTFSMASTGSFGSLLHFQVIKYPQVP
jgi:hypothetical protein